MVIGFWRTTIQHLETTLRNRCFGFKKSITRKVESGKRHRDNRYFCNDNFYNNYFYNNYIYNGH